jgi:hypothetical protein
MVVYWLGSLLLRGRGIGETGRVHTIEFVIAEDDFGMGVQSGVEPVVDGVSLVDVVKRADGEISYAGLVPPAEFLAVWRRAMDQEDACRVPVLGCVCGLSACSSVTAAMQVAPDAILWSEFRGSPSDGRDQASGGYSEVGPFQFDRARFRAALDAPLLRDAPLRERADLEALSAAMPDDHDAWLREMTMSFGRDFFYTPDEALDVVAAALQLFESRGRAIPEQAVRAWAKDRRFSDEAVNGILSRFRELGQSA